jgi:4-amino-4-deoxy-L-arabinose transferase-like glycosyltransferase
MAATRTRQLDWGGAALALLAAVALFTRYSIDDGFRRDEAIYVYGGQQLTHGLAPYASIFDPKTPLSTLLTGLGAAIAHALGTDELHTIRILFLVLSCLTVVAVYALALRLWESRLAGLAAAVVFASFPGWALDAIGGPDAKVPGILLAVVAMALAVRRRWLWAALAASTAFLAWQPLGIYIVVVIAFALVASEPAERRGSVVRVLAGTAAPLAAMTLYFLVAGALPEFVEAAFTFPLTGVQRGNETLADHFTVIADTVDKYYAGARSLVWVGLALVPALLPVRLLLARGGGLRGAVRDPYVTVVVASFVALALFSLTDFQGYADLYPALPYAAIALGGALALVVGRIGHERARRAATAVALIAVALLGVKTWSQYSVERTRDTDLIRQRAQGAQIARLLGPGGTLYSLGDPTPLVLTGRRNPSRFIYLGSGVAHWAVKHGPGGFAGWTARIRAARPAVILVGSWSGSIQMRMEQWLSRRYPRSRLGIWHVYLDPSARRRAEAAGLTVKPPVA